MTSENMSQALAMRKLYIEICEEQRTIDIDKACEWIMGELRNPKADTFQEFVDNFRKAMEE